MVFPLAFRSGSIAIRYASYHFQNRSVPTPLRYENHAEKNMSQWKQKANPIWKFEQSHSDPVWWKHSINFQKNKVVPGKICSFCNVSLVLPILFVLTLVFDNTVMYGHVAFSVIVLSSKKRYSSFLKKDLVFQKTSFKVSKYHWRHADLLNGRLF